MEPEVIHAGVLRVSLRLLKHMFQLPDGWEITNIDIGDYGRSLRVFIQGDDLPAVKEDFDIPQITDIDAYVLATNNYPDGKVYQRVEFVKVEKHV